MELPAAPWEAGAGAQGGEGPALAALRFALSAQRLTRELSFRLRAGLRDATSPFSHVRLGGVRRLAVLLETVSASDDLGPLFCDSQLYPDLQIVPVLFENSLSVAKSNTELPDKHNVETVWQSSSEEDTFGALRLLEGCCILDPSSRSLGARHGAAKELLDRLEMKGVSSTVQSASLDALLAVLLDCPGSQQTFREVGGVTRVARLLKNRLSDITLRLKCAEFLQLLVEQTIPSTEGRTMEGGLLRRDDVLGEAAACLGNEVATLLRNGVAGGLPTAANLRAYSQLILNSS